MLFCPFRLLWIETGSWKTNNHKSIPTAPLWSARDLVLAGSGLPRFNHSGWNHNQDDGIPLHPCFSCTHSNNGSGMDRFPGLVANSPQRKSGLFALGLAFGTSVSFVIEMGVLLVIALVGIFVVAANPTSIETLNRLSEQFSSPNIDIQSLQSLLAPYITSPIAILGILGFFSVLTPLIEEAAKPIGLWFFAKKNLTPMDGFVGGMLSGAGFTVVETMFNAGQSNPESWFVLIISRVGTGALHILASGMVGWGLAMAWSKHKYMNLFFSYLIAVCLHGLWNGVTLFYGISELLPEGSDSWLVIFGKINPYILGILATAIFLSLIFINLKFVKEQTMQLDPTASPDGVG